MEAAYVPNTPYREATGRDISALLNPRPLALIGACDNHEVDFATIAWITPISHSPAMLAFALRAKSRTMQLAQAAGACSVCLLDASDPTSAEIATYCGNTTGHRENKGAHVAHRLVDVHKEVTETSTSTTATVPAASNTDDPTPTQCVPVTTNALSWLTCTIETIQETGDHLLAIARIERACTHCASDDKGRVSCTDALLCVQHDAFAHAALL